MKLIVNKTAVFLLMLSTFWFAMGIHGVDTAWNMKYVEYVTKEQLLDQTVYGVLAEKNSIYQNGLSAIYVGFVFSVLASLYIGTHQPESRRTGRRLSFLRQLFVRKIRGRSDESG